MNRFAWSLGLLVACSGGGGVGDKKPPIPDAPTELVNCPDCGGMVRVPVIAEGLAQGIAITEISALQSLKVPIMKNGAALDMSAAPKWGYVKYAAKRDSILRLHLTPGSGWTPHPIVAQLRFVAINPSGYVVHTVASKPYMPKGASSDADLSSTLNIDLAGSMVLPDTSFSVWLTDADQGKSPQAMDPARWPRDGSLTAFGAEPALDKVRVKLVPIRSNGQVTTVTPDMIESFRSEFYAIYPAGSVEISVRDPYDYTFVDWGAMLNEVGKIRSMDSPDPDIYYYGIVPNVGMSGILGISGVGSPWSTGDAEPWVAAHEVGHAHGLEHANCGGAALGPDMGGPYMDAGIGVWGYNQNKANPSGFPVGPGQLIDPNGNPKPIDFMGYCHDKRWISDYHYNQLFARVQSDNRLVMAKNPTPRVFDRMYSAQVTSAGALVVDDFPHVGWSESGVPREVDIGGVKETGYWFPYDHIPGGFLMVSDAARMASRLGRAHLKL
jgi:hypothetical protein